MSAAASGQLRDYARAWTRDAPGEAGGWEFLGICEGIGLKNPQASIAAFRRFLQIQPDECHAWNALGIEYHFANDPADAVGAFKQARHWRRSTPTTGTILRPWSPN